MPNEYASPPSSTEPPNRARSSPGSADASRAIDGPHSPTSLLRDERGAVYILGLVFGTLLFGVIWNIASVGDAIFWRERAQDVADAAAFDFAVWHARGMNMLSVLNLLMALVMAALIAWRILNMALFVLAMFCIFGKYVPYIGSACLVYEQSGIDAAAAEADPVVVDSFVRTLHALHATQKVVASATPILAFIHTPDTIRTRFPRTDSAVSTVGMTLMPTVETLAQRGLGEFAGRLETLATGKSPTPGLTEGVIQERLGTVFSLPAQADGYGTLCKLGGKAFVYSSPLSNTTIGSWIGLLIGSAPEVFCEGGLQSVPKPAKRFIEYLGYPICVLGAEWRIKKCQKKFVERFEDRANDADRRRARRGQEPSGAPGSAKRPSLTDVKLAKTWELYQNGNLMGQVWSTAQTPRPHLAANDRALEIADRAHVGALGEHPVSAEETVMAQAEFYEDCREAWSACRGNSLYRINWRSRLRRIQSLSALGDVFDLALNVSVQFGVHGAWSAVFKRSFPKAEGVLGDRPSTFLNRFLRKELLFPGFDYFDANEDLQELVTGPLH